MSDVEDGLLRLKAVFFENMDSLLNKMTASDKNQEEAESRIKLIKEMLRTVDETLDATLDAVKRVRDERNVYIEAVNQFKEVAAETFREYDMQIALAKATGSQSAGKGTPSLPTFARDNVPGTSPVAYEQNFPDLSVSANRFQTKASIKRLRTETHQVKSTNLNPPRLQAATLFNTVPGCLETNNNEERQKKSPRRSPRSPQPLTLGDAIGELPKAPRRQSEASSNKKKGEASKAKESFEKPGIRTVFEPTHQREPHVKDISEEENDMAEDTRTESRTEKCATPEAGEIPERIVVSPVAEPPREKKLPVRDDSKEKSSGNTSVSPRPAEKKDTKDANRESEAKNETKDSVPTGEENISTHEDSSPIMPKQEEEAMKQSTSKTSSPPKTPDIPPENIFEQDERLQHVPHASPSKSDDQNPSEKVPTVPLLPTAGQLHAEENIGTDKSIVPEDTSDEKQPDQPTPRDTSAIDSVSDETREKDEQETVDIPTAGEAPESQGKSNRQLKRDRLLAEKEDRIRAKLEKSDRERLDRAAKEAQKKAAADALVALEDDEHEEQEEDEHEEQEEDEERVEQAPTEEERKKLSETLFSVYFEIFLEFYRRTTIARVPYELRRQTGEREEAFDEEIAKRFMEGRTTFHALSGNNDLATFCEVLLKNLDPIVLDDFRPVFETRHELIKSFLIEKELYANIRSSIFMKTAERDSARAKEYVSNFIVNYYKIQEKIRDQELEPDFGYKTNWLQKKLTEESIRHIGEEEAEIATNFFEEMLRCFQSNAMNNVFQPILIKEIISDIEEKEFSIFVVDGVILARSFNPPETIYSQYIRLVCRTCTIAILPPAAEP